MRVLLPALLMITALGSASAQTTGQSQSSASDHPIYLKSQDMKWDRIVPELGAGSPEITILHVDQKTGATKLMIRVPQDFHVPKHWHTANETHTVVSGTFIMAHDGKRKSLVLGRLTTSRASLSMRHGPNLMREPCSSSRLMGRGM
jgi:hypothetical protein